MEGWISLNRSIQNHWLWKDEKKLKWWLYLLLTVNHSEQKVVMGNNLVKCGRGQCVKSLDTHAKNLNTTKKTVSTFFKLLEKDGMLKVENLKITTRITICNYDTYQGEVNGSETVSKRLVNDTETTSKRPLPSNNNVNNENNENTVNKQEGENEIFPAPVSKSKILISEKDKGVLNRTISLFPEDVVKTVIASTPKKKQWLDAVNKLNRIDGFTHEEIEEVIKFGRNDDFWKDNFISILSLRKSGKNGLTKFVTIKTAMNGNRDKQRNGRNSKRKRVEPKFEGL